MKKVRLFKDKELRARFFKYNHSRFYLCEAVGGQIKYSERGIWHTIRVERDRAHKGFVWIYQIS